MLEKVNRWMASLSAKVLPYKSPTPVINSEPSEKRDDGRGDKDRYHYKGLNNLSLSLPVNKESKIPFQSPEDFIYFHSITINMEEK